ncbi:hypothetical protein L9F63_002509, partial [Diploptera punctata]
FFLFQFQLMDLNNYFLINVFSSICPFVPMLFVRTNLTIEILYLCKRLSCTLGRYHMFVVYFIICIILFYCERQRNSKEIFS